MPRSHKKKVGSTRKSSKLKNYIGFVRDHSGSMKNLRKAATQDFNDSLRAAQHARISEDQETLVSVVTCGPYRMVSRAVVNTAVERVPALTNYAADDGTPLFDAVGEVIDILESVPDRDDPNVSFLVSVTTDGHENCSQKWTGPKIATRIRELQKTDRWTFAFRVPVGEKRSFCNQFGIPEGNVLEWEATDQGMREAAAQTVSSTQNWYKGRSAGIRSSGNFYVTDLTGVRASTVKAKLIDISKQLEVWPVSSSTVIRSFCERKSGKPFLKGAAFYQLTKTEKKVQDYKQIIIRDKKTGAAYSGGEARNLLGLPHVGEVKLVPGNHAQYDIFIQSTSVNRKIPAGTQVAYWANVGTPYIEGVSAPW